MVVVCSGAKIVLDLPATREWLETNGITVVGYECDEMPAFYSRSSGLAVDVRVDAAADVAHIFRVQREIGFAGALLVTVPVPSEAEVSAANLQQSLKRALGQAELQRITGRELTPFLLAHMAEDSSGATLRANIALLKNNSLVATQIARALLL
jgi:pseudouridine-5'-phosphate glycosidase